MPVQRLKEKNSQNLGNNLFNNFRATAKITDFEPTSEIQCLKYFLIGT